jgi:excisionase family DNA binding protein
VSKANALTLDDVASHLGVHYQTVYRWVRADRLKARKMRGSYVVQPRDLDAFVAARDTPARPPAPSTDRLDRQRDAMLDALLDGNETDARTIARTLISNGTSVTTLISKVLVPPLIEIGARWHERELAIFVEHRASAIVERMLGDISPNPRGRRRGRVVVAAVSGDHHSLPTAMATAALREDNWHVEHLGSDMPIDEIVAFAETHDIDVAVISATTSKRRRLAEEARRALADGPGIPTLVGRPGATLEELQADARRLIQDI